MIKRSGPEHERTFWIEVCVNETVYGPGIGQNKKSAEQEAAKIACEALLNWGCIVKGAGDMAARVGNSRLGIIAW